jgi:hypothetical protein
VQLREVTLALAGATPRPRASTTSAATAATRAGNGGARGGHPESMPRVGPQTFVSGNHPSRTVCRPLLGEASSSRRATSASRTEPEQRRKSRPHDSPDGAQYGGDAGPPLERPSRRWCWPLGRSVVSSVAAVSTVAVDSHCTQHQRGHQSSRDCCGRERHTRVPVAGRPDRSECGTEPSPDQCRERSI